MSMSEDSPSLLSFSSCNFSAFNKMVLMVACSPFFSLCSFISCSFNFPNNVDIHLCEVLWFWIVVTFGCHFLSNDLRIFMFNSLFMKLFPSASRWLTVCVNRVWNHLLSFCFIWSNSYSWRSVFFRALFTSSVPSCVTSTVSHISFVDLHFDICKIR